MKSRPLYELANVLERNREQLDSIISNTWKLRTLQAIRRCRTAQLGGHVDVCLNPKCQKVHLSYNSCRNRHCPKCQGHKRQQWIADRMADLLPVPYFHVVFTLPDSLNELCLTHPKTLYSTLFKAAWQCIHGFGQNPKFLGAQTGMIAVLHTWGSNLSLHPHLHCIVPAGGITQKGYWKPSKAKGKYLFPVKALSQVFRAKFIELLRKQIKLFLPLAKQLFEKPWVVYAKKPFLGPQQVVEYLGRYTHKVAISNHRIVDLPEGKVCFKAKNYRRGGQKQLISLSDQEFIRRFALHILPKGFVRIRHYGLLSNARKKEKIKIIREQLGVKVPESKPVQTHLKRCPTCKKGQLITLFYFQSRAPPVSSIPKHWINSIIANNQ